MLGLVGVLISGDFRILRDGNYTYTDSLARSVDIEFPEIFEFSSKVWVSKMSGFKLTPS